MTRSQGQPDFEAVRPATDRDTPGADLGASVDPPRSRSPRAGARAFSLIEVLVVIGIIAFLLGITAAVIGKARSSATSVKCLSNLRQIHAAFQLYTTDNSGRYPDPVRMDVSWEDALHRYLNFTGVFQCPADYELYPSIGSSYDWRETGDPASTLAGQLVRGVRSDAVMAFDTLPAWHARKRMNAVRIDGSAQPLATDDCLADLNRPIVRCPIKEP